MPNRTHTPHHELEPSANRWAKKTSRPLQVLGSHFRTMRAHAGEEVELEAQVGAMLNICDRQQLPFDQD